MAQHYPLEFIDYFCGMNRELLYWKMTLLSWRLNLFRLMVARILPNVLIYRFGLMVVSCFIWSTNLMFLQFHYLWLFFGRQCFSLPLLWGTNWGATIHKYHILQFRFRYSPFQTNCIACFYSGWKALLFGILILGKSSRLWTGFLDPFNSFGTHCVVILWNVSSP